MLQRYGDDGDGDGGGGDYVFSSGPHDGRGRTTGCCRLLVGCVSGRTPLRCTGVRVRWRSSSVRCGRLSTSRSRRANLGGRVQWCRREEGRLHCRSSRFFAHENASLPRNHAQNDAFGHPTLSKCILQLALSWPCFFRMCSRPPTAMEAWSSFSRVRVISPGLHVSLDRNPNTDKFAFTVIARKPNAKLWRRRDVHLSRAHA